MASATTTDYLKAASRPDTSPFSLIEEEGLAARLTRELSRAARDLATDPRTFIRDLFSSDTRDYKRRRLIYIGLCIGLAAHAVLLAVIVTLGWHRVLDEAIEDKPQYKVTTMLEPGALNKSSDVPEIKPEAPRGNGKGGGGGGQQAQFPASKGAPPQMLPRLPIVQANPSNIQIPALLIAANIQGPEAPPPPTEVALGDPKGKPGNFSPGPGTGGGVGSGNGEGVGSGNRAGLGSGSGGGKDGAEAGIPDGSGVKGPIPWSRIRDYPGSAPFSWIYRATPIVTPEAQANKVSGTVLLSATFRADGTITDIEVRNPVAYMTESAVEALKRSRFRPATINGVPITLTNVLVRINVHY